MQNKNNEDNLKDKLEDNFEDEFEYENDFDNSMEEDLGFIGDGSKKPIFMIITIVLAAIAIILLCVVIWMMSHPNKGGDSNLVANDQTQEQFVEKNKNETLESTVEETIEDTTEDITEDSMESSPVNTQESLPESSEPSKETVPSSQVPEELPTNIPQEMTFQSAEESVTAKEKVNLRSKPQSDDDSYIVAQINNGEVLSRVGINSATGWSKLEYNGQTVYAVSNYLTTDLDYKPVDYSTPPKDPNTVVTSNNRTITFTNCDDIVTPKILVNVRVEPQTEGDENIYTVLESGVQMHRTGYDTASGWSRVEYDDKVLYVVTSLVKVVE